MKDCRERHCICRDRISSAQRGRLEAQLVRGLVNDGFDHINRLGAAAAAIGRNRHRIGQHRDDLRMNRRDPVSIHQAAQSDRQWDRRAVSRKISSDGGLPLRA
jgi:hypothetical protein